MRDIRALTFDIGGTVFDWQTPVKAAVASLAAMRGVDVNVQQFAVDWRASLFAQLAQVRDGTLPWLNADQLHRAALDRLAERYSPLALTPSDRDELTAIWHRLPAWDEFAPALRRLQQRYPCVVLTVLSFAIALDCSRASGITWDGIISCEFLGHYKPDVEAYLKAVRLIGIPTDQVLMVASHPGDLRAAKSAGLRTAFVRPKLNEPDLPGLRADPGEKFDIETVDFASLADRLCG